MKYWNTFLGQDSFRKRAFPGHQPGEQVELITVFHWMSLVPYFLGMGILFSITALFISSQFYSDFFQTPQIYTATISIAILLHAVCFRFYNYFLKVIIVTNFRVIDVRHSVFLKREREAIPMSNIQDFRYQQKGVFQRIFNYGTLMILGSSTDLKYVFRYVPKVNKIHHILGEVHQKNLRQRSSIPATTPVAPMTPPKG